MDRDEVLHAAGASMREPVWALMTQLELTLGGLSAAPHFDLGDPAAVASAIHAALPQAAIEAGLTAHGFCVRSCEVGPANKICGGVVIGGQKLELSLELHLADRRGRTRKNCHQFAGLGVEGAPYFPGFELDAPPSLLFFLAYQLGPTGTRIERVHLVFADGVDRKMIELHREFVDTAAAHTAPAEAAEAAVGSKIKVRQRAKGDGADDGREADQRGNAAPST